MARSARLLLSCTLVVPRRWRFLLVDFLVRIWRMKACERLIEPPERTLNRFAADFFDFILGTALLLSAIPSRRASPRQPDPSLALLPLLPSLPCLPSAPWAPWARQASSPSPAPPSSSAPAPSPSAGPRAGET